MTGQAVGSKIDLTEASGADLPPIGTTRIIRSGGVTQQSIDGAPFAPLGSSFPAIILSAPSGGDDSAAIQSAITIASVTGAIVQLGPGTWRIKPGVINFASAQGVTLRGSGRFATKVSIDDSLGNSGGDGITMTNCLSCSIESLSFTAPSVRTAGWAVKVIGGNAPIIDTVITPTDFQCKRVNFVNQFGCIDQTDNDSAYPGGEWISLVHDVFVYTPGANSVLFHVNTWGGNQDFRNVWVSGVSPANRPAAALKVEVSGGFRLYAFDTLLCAAGVWVAGANSKFARIQAAQISSCYFDSSGTNGVFIQAAAGCLVGEITFTNCWFATNEAGGGALLTIGDGLVNIDDVQCVGCRFVAALSSGIIVNRATNVELTNCMIAGAATSGIVILNSSDVGLSNVKVGTYKFGSTPTPVGLTCDTTSTYRMDASCDFSECTVQYVQDARPLRPFVGRTQRVAIAGAPTLVGDPFYTPCVNLSDVTVAAGVTAVSGNGGVFQCSGAGTVGTARFPASTSIVTNARTQKWSISARIKITVAPGATETIRLVNMTDGATADAFFGVVGASNTTHYALSIGGVVTVSSIATDGNWHDVQIRADGTNIKAYVDEALAATGLQSGAANAAAFSQIAAFGTSTTTFLIDDWAVFTEQAA